MDTEDGRNADLTRRAVLSTAGAAGIVAGADALLAMVMHRPESRLTW